MSQFVDYTTSLLFLLLLTISCLLLDNWGSTFCQLLESLLFFELLLLLLLLSSLFTCFQLFFSQLFLLVLLVLREEIDNSSLHDTIADDASSVLSFVPWKRCFIPWLVHSGQNGRVAFSTFPATLSLKGHAGRTLEDRNSEVAGVALDAPAFLVVVVEANMASEAPEAKVDLISLGFFPISLFRSKEMLTSWGL